MKFLKRRTPVCVTGYQSRDYEGRTVGQYIRALKEQGVAPDTMVVRGCQDDPDFHDIDPMSDIREDPMDYAGAEPLKHYPTPAKVEEKVVVAEQPPIEQITE